VCKSEISGHDASLEPVCVSSRPSRLEKRATTSRSPAAISTILGAIAVSVVGDRVIEPTAITET